MSSTSDELVLLSKSFPDKPGIYLFRDIENKVIYVGKAKSLMKRIRSYFGKGLGRKEERIQDLATNLEYITTNTEIEALILENELIKIHKPILNARLKDDKTYPYLRITISEEFPRVEIVRKREEKSQDIFFGPYADTKSLRIALKKALTIFPIARCNKVIIHGKKDRSCLFYQMHRCAAPCAGKIDKKEYKKLTKQFVKLFEGKQKELLTELKVEMNEAAEKLEFENAGLIRDKIQILEKIVQKQIVVSKDQSAEYDIIGLVKGEKNSLIQLMIMRQGRIVEQKHFVLNIPFELDEPEILTIFVKQYYSKTEYIPQKILTSMQIDDERAINIWLINLSDSKDVSQIIFRAKTKEEKSLIELAKKNAEANLYSQLKVDELKEKKINKSLDELKEVLELQIPPKRIEGYDISTLHGTNSVGSCVVFENGLPKKSDYRKFNIKTIQQQDDFASLQEVLHRRFTGSLAKSMENPDLILIDGGAGQVSSVKEILVKYNINIPMIGLSKELEEIHFPDERQSLILNERSEGLKLLQRVRDEAHRFAISFHRQKRSGKMIKSSLEEIPGIGKKRMEILLENFQSIKEIKEASIEELENIPGINRKIAEEIVRFYKNQL
ncbi:MAG: excinuclease ABC subunit UvrC [Asgard group archaeon]|nr:excinuclease ABC subunit UvrC [Asgard group archaeon]